MTKKPWLKWYPADWRQEPSLRMCSRAARSLWMDMLGLMHEAEPYGHLLINGRQPTMKQLAAVLGDRPRDVEIWCAELEASGVFSRTESGVIFSRRMVRDSDRSDEGRKWIEKRWPRGKPNSPPNRSPIPENSVDPITQRPEARDQKPEYKFAGKVIRLNAADYDGWKKLYHTILDLDAELNRIDTGFAARKPDNWFVACSNMLNAKHQKNLEQRPKTGITPLGVGG